MGKPVIIENSWDEFSPIVEEDIWIDKTILGVVYPVVIDPTERVGTEDRAIKLTEITKDTIQAGFTLVLDGYGVIAYTLDEDEDRVLVKPVWPFPQIS